MGEVRNSGARLAKGIRIATRQLGHQAEIMLKPEPARWESVTAGAAADGSGNAGCAGGEHPLRPASKDRMRAVTTTGLEMLSAERQRRARLQSSLAISAPKARDRR